MAGNLRDGISADYFNARSPGCLPGLMGMIVDEVA